MSTVLHITSGDIAGAALVESGVVGEILVWHDVLYDGPRSPGWPSPDILIERSEFLEDMTGGGLSKSEVLEVFHKQYERLKQLEPADAVVLWFDACLFDQSMLVHILACLDHLRFGNVELLCIDSFPGIDPYNGLGQLRPEQLSVQYGRRVPVSAEQFTYAVRVDRAFVDRDIDALTELSETDDAHIPWIPEAARRWLEELPDKQTGLGKLERLALHAINSGCEKPWKIFEYVASADTPPQFWGDITLWQKINGLADRDPPLVAIDGPAPRLPQWEGPLSVDQFGVFPAGQKKGK